MPLKTKPFDEVDYLTRWAEMRSFSDESPFTVHTAVEMIGAYQDGEKAK